MLRVWIAAHRFHVAADADCRRISRIVLRRSTIYFLQLRVINICSEGILNRIEVSAVTVCCDLHAVPDSASAIFHELFRPSAIAPTYEIRDYELCLGVDSDPRPHIAPALHFLFRADILRLRTHEAPNLIGL